jgi:hypothetical protein
VQVNFDNAIAVHGSPPRNSAQYAGMICDDARSTVIVVARGGASMRE